MSSRFVRRLGLFLVLASMPGGAAAHAAPRRSPTDTIRQANDRLRDMLAKNAEPKAITAELRDLFDIESLTRRALAAHWSKMTATQRKAIVDTLRQLVERNYLAQLRSNLSYEIEYLGEEQRGDDVLVKTLVKGQRKGRPLEIHVDYLLQAHGDHWSAYDVVTDDVSLLDNYRAQFNRIIKKEGVDGLIARMKKKLGAR